MKRLLSLMLVFSMLFIAVPVFADGGQQVEPTVNITRNESDGSNFHLEFKWAIDTVNKDDYFEFQFPIPPSLPSNDKAELISLGGDNYKIVFKDTFVDVVGSIGGSKTIIVEETLSPIVVNGKAIKTDFNTPHIPETPGQVDDNTVRDRFYKYGFVNGSQIDWQLTIGGDKKGLPKDTGITDEVGDGHEIIPETVEFIHYIGEDGTILDLDNTDVVTIKEINSDKIDFTTFLGSGEFLLIKYTTQVTDFDRLDYSNQVIIEGEKKFTETVKVDSWGDIDGNKPEPNPDPNKPDENENPDDNDDKEPEKLPQVGEFFARPEYIIAVILLIIARFMKKKEQ